MGATEKMAGKNCGQRESAKRKQGRQTDLENWMPELRWRINPWQYRQ
jgi:hypothetical protein